MTNRKDRANVVARGLTAFVVMALLACGGAVPTGDDSTVVGESSTRVLEVINLEKLEDKIRGGWAGQMIGVSYGFPTEFRYLGQIIPEEELPEWKPEMIENSINQDDLYVEMTFAAVIDKKGWGAATEDSPTTQPAARCVVAFRLC